MLLVTQKTNTTIIKSLLLFTILAKLFLCKFHAKQEGFQSLLLGLVVGSYP